MAKRRPDPKKSVRERAHDFAFEGVPEKDRFGIFDPALRGLFLVGLLFGAVFGVGWLFDFTRGRPAPWGEVGVVLAVVAVVGVLGYRRLWKKPAEKDTLLAMAARDDAVRVANAGRAKGAAKEGATAPERR